MPIITDITFSTCLRASATDTPHGRRHGQNASYLASAIDSVAACRSVVRIPVFETRHIGVYLSCWKISLHVQLKVSTITVP